MNMDVNHELFSCCILSAQEIGPNLIYAHDRANQSYELTEIYYTCLIALCLGLPRWASTRKVSQSWFTGARDSEWQWHLLGRMQICTSPQTDNHAGSPPFNFYRPYALPDAQPTASKHWRQKALKACRFSQIVCSSKHQNYSAWCSIK